ncbi:Acyl-CoA reductase [Jatrophihabitans endophyticus]|uniref:Acyl-CoA reductase n=1 Tax=Jatrophihabitans endophyticus TaxID=1206085 RepID=A0A1M5PS42_9ACTN|nr:aldehyde dehydrogenase [Jatrophihabitans endophyticus]SHH04578.1 Acyl-CoA reductase [Jatrophihabitans endophyticus]
MTSVETDRIELINPATEERLGEVPAAGAAEVDAAVRTARTALTDPAWASLGPAERAGLLRALADVLHGRMDELAELITRQNGMPLKMVRWGNVWGPIAAYRYYADLVESMAFETLRESAYGRTLVRREPVGVVGVIAPWNGPQVLAAWKLAPALAAGCTAVLKPAPETSLDALLLAEAFEQAGFPPGVFTVVTGGRETGELLVDHLHVAKIAFTGSTAAGRAIAARAGAQLKSVVLELGGKSAAILLDDADVAGFADQVVRLCSPNSGQVCYSCTRILAPSSRYDEVVDVVVESMRGAHVGDPLERATNFGPLVSARQRARVEGYIATGQAEGADLVSGGGRPADLGRGYFVEPTVFRNVDNGMRIAQEEIFGPVLSVISYDDTDDAVRIANDSEYGLGGAVFTADPERGLAVARRIETGSIGINGYEIAMDAPFGGYKSSGLGRELGPEGIEPYLETKSIYNPPEAS